MECAYFLLGYYADNDIIVKNILLNISINKNDDIVNEIIFYLYVRGIYDNTNVTNIKYDIYMNNEFDRYKEYIIGLDYNIKMKMNIIYIIGLSLIENVKLHNMCYTIMTDDNIYKKFNFIMGLIDKNSFKRSDYKSKMGEFLLNLIMGDDLIFV
jgi:hypothetical protein